MNKNTAKTTDPIWDSRNSDEPMQIDQSKILPIEQETDINRLRQLARDYKEEYGFCFTKLQQKEKQLNELTALCIQGDVKGIREFLDNPDGNTFQEGPDIL